MLLSLFSSVGMAYLIKGGTIYLSAIALAVI